MSIRAYPVARSVLSKILPGSLLKRPGSGGTFSAAYCYTVWWRHIIQLHQTGLIGTVSDIQKMAEIGPGDSLGIGLTGLLSGVDEYYAFDVIEHANNLKNKQVLAEIVQMLQNRQDLPHEGPQFRNTNPKLDDYTFPTHLLGNRGDEINYQERSSNVDKALDAKHYGDIRVEYVAPWYEKMPDFKGELDMIYSQAVMEHVIEIEHAYNKMFEWLKPGGIISHQIDYKAHEMTTEWNGHWYIGDGMWKFLLSGRKYPINRLPHSAHVREIEKAGFVIKNIVPVITESKFGRRPPKIRGIQFLETDYTISSAHIQAVKPA